MIQFEAILVTSSNSMDQSELHSLHAFENSVDDFRREIINQYSSRMYYKYSEETQNLFKDLKSMFHKYSRDMYRKFKRMLETADQLTEVQPGTDFSDLAKHKNKLDSVLQRYLLEGIEEKNELVWRPEPQNLTMLESFPFSRNPKVEEALQM